MAKLVKLGKWVSTATLCVIVMTFSMLTAEEPEVSTAEQASAIELAERQLRKCEMQLADEPRAPIKRLDRALLLFGDAARKNTNGTLWTFGVSGRPHAFLELYQGIEPNSKWCHAATLTGTRRIVMKTPESGSWQPTSTQIDPVPIPDATVPDERAEVRLRQLKELARRFAAHEFWDPDNSRYELRLLVRPIHRYSDASERVHDGAAFVFANGTNPEVILLIEAIGPMATSARWHYSLARLGSAELHVSLDGKEVWKQERTPGIVGTAEDPYWLFFSNPE